MNDHGKHGKLPSKGSEDVSHLLKPPGVTSKETVRDEPREHGPGVKIDWAIDVEFEDSQVLHRSRILEVFDPGWCEANGQPEIYGLSSEAKHWTFVRAMDVPETYTKLAFAWPLFDTIDNRPLQIGPALERYRSSLADLLNRMVSALGAGFPA